MQSARNKLDILKHHIKQSNFSIFTLSETWFTEDLDGRLLGIVKYDLIRMDRNWSEPGKSCIKKGGGIAIYIKNELTYSTVEVDKYNVSCKDIEILWIAINLSNQKKKLFGTVYWPPSGNVKGCIDKS